MRYGRRTICTTMALFAIGCVGQLAAQEQYPTRPIAFIVPTAPGGGADLLARQIADAAEATLHQKLVVENKPGGGGTVGVTVASQSKPDGYTLALIWNGPLTTIPHTLSVPYTLDSYTPISVIGSSSYIMCVAPDFPASNATEFLKVLAANPGKYTYGNDGVGGTMQLGAERIFHHYGIKARPVPFSGAGETARNFLGGHVDIYGGSLPPILPHVAAGKAKCLLLTSADDNPAVPTASGLRALGIPELETLLWYGVIGPKGLPSNLVKQLTDVFRSAGVSEKIRSALANIGGKSDVRGPQDMAELIKSESDALGKVARDVGLTRK